MLYPTPYPTASPPPPPMGQVMYPGMPTTSVPHEATIVVRITRTITTADIPSEILAEHSCNRPCMSTIVYGTITRTPRAQLRIYWYEYQTKVCTAQLDYVSYLPYGYTNTTAPYQLYLGRPAGGPPPTIDRNNPQPALPVVALPKNAAFNVPIPTSCAHIQPMSPYPR